MSWRPAGGVHATLRQTPWSKAETKEAARAVHILEALLAPHLDSDPASFTSDEHQYLVILTVYSHTLCPTGGGPTKKMVALTNSAYEACRALDGFIGGDYRNILSSPKVSSEELFNLLMWSISIVDAQLVPGLKVPAKAQALVPVLWRFLGSYPLVGANGFLEAAHDDTFYDMAYLATHIGYFPTGYGRHALAIKEAPWLYRFLRENFYAVLDMGELDLVAEFVEILRLMGCTPEPIGPGTYGSVFRKSVTRLAHNRDPSAS